MEPAEVPPTRRVSEGWIRESRSRGCGCGCGRVDGFDRCCCCLSVTMSSATILRTSNPSLKLVGNLCSGASR